MTKLLCSLRAGLRAGAALAGIAALGVLTACDPTVAFEVKVDGEAVVQGDPLLGALGGFPVFSDLVAVDISQTDEFENHDTRKENVRAARLTKLRLTVVDPEDASFDFLSEITFFVESPNHPRRQVATKAIPQDATTVDLELADVDLAPYVRDDGFSLRTDAEGRRPRRDTRVRAELSFDIVAGTGPLS